MFKVGDVVEIVNLAIGDTFNTNLKIGDKGMVVELSQIVGFDIGTVIVNFGHITYISQFSQYKKDNGYLMYNSQLKLVENDKQEFKVGDKVRGIFTHRIGTITNHIKVEAKKFYCVDFGSCSIFIHPEKLELIKEDETSVSSNNNKGDEKMEKLFKKCDLRTGMVVEDKNGNIGVVLLNTSHGDGIKWINYGFEELTHYDNNLNPNKCSEIEKIYNVNRSNNYDILTDSVYQDIDNLIWEREKQVRKVTMDEVYKVFGEKVKIVD